jgi:hypothetical protein
MRTQQQIDEQVKWLLENKAKVGQFNFFEEDNHRAIEAQIAVLEGDLERSDIDRKAQSGEWLSYMAEAAESALAWRDDGDDEAEPKANWAALLKV